MPLPCPKPKTLLGKTTLVFEVLPSAKLIVPQTAQVTLNPSEVDLFRARALSLNAKIKKLEANLVNADPAHNRELLQRSLADGLRDLDMTEHDFRRLEGSPAKQDYAAGFFEDIRTTYREAEAVINAELQSETRLVLVADKAPTGSSMVKVGLNALHRNALGYTVVADAASMCFDLEVSSYPAGATVSYGKRGDKLKKAPNVTNSTLKSLDFARTTVRFDKPGYEPVQIEHDPLIEKNHSIAAELKKKR